MFGATILGAGILGAGESSAGAPPEYITIVAPTDGATVSESATVTVSGATSSSGDVQVSIDGGGWATLATPAGGAYSGSVGPLAAGAHTIAVRQSDATSVTDSVSITSVADSITITSPTEWQFFRKSGVAGTISIDVSYVGSPTDIEYRFAKTGAESWSSAAATGSPQTLTLAGQSSGHGAVEVRFASNPSVADSVANIGVGITVAVAGESNASGRGATNNTAPATNAFLYSVDGVYRQLADPYDKAAGADTYSISADASAGGSAIPRLAQRIVDSGETVCFIPCAKGGTRISAWARNVSTTTLYGAMKARIDAAGGADHLIMWIGANDAIAGETEANFEADLSQFVTDVQSDFGCPVVLPKLHYASGSYSDAQADLMRAAQDTVIAGTSGAVSGGDLNGLTSALHFSSAELIVVANTIYAAAFTPPLILRTWNGSAWVATPMKIWNGSAWVAAALKRWDGSVWQSVQ